VFIDSILAVRQALLRTLGNYPTGEGREGGSGCIKRKGKGQETRTRRGRILQVRHEKNGDRFIQGIHYERRRTEPGIPSRGSSRKGGQKAVLGGGGHWEGRRMGLVVLEKTLRELSAELWQKTRGEARKTTEELLKGEGDPKVHLAD